MNILPAEFIKQRRRGERIDRAALEAFIAGFVSGEIPDYQMSAWLMAACFQPLNDEETGWLTQTMTGSGRRLTFSRSSYLTCDKHSTGGVGDKTSLIIAPIVAAAGVRVPMMSGRGLGHTGGTLDKLESIPGMRVQMDLEHVSKTSRSRSVSLTSAKRKTFARRTGKCTPSAMSPARSSLVP